ncbi:MAG: hypothetical protein ACREB9_00270 [Thermoplasmata archaeon]
MFEHGGLVWRRRELFARETGWQLIYVSSPLRRAVQVVGIDFVAKRPPARDDRGVLEFQLLDDELCLGIYGVSSIIAESYVDIRPYIFADAHRLRLDVNVGSPGLVKVAIRIRGGKP